MEWYRSDNGVVSGKIAGKKEAGGRKEIGHSYINKILMYRVSTVYVPYINRISTVIISGLIAERWRENGELRIMN